MGLTSTKKFTLNPSSKTGMRAIVDGLISFLGITRPTKGLQIVDVRSSAAYNGNDMIDRQLYIRTATTQALTPIVGYEGLPFGVGKTASGLRQARATSVVKRYFLPWVLFFIPSNLFLYLFRVVSVTIPGALPCLFWVVLAIVAMPLPSSLPFLLYVFLFPFLVGLSCLFGVFCPSFAGCFVFPFAIFGQRTPPLVRRVCARNAFSSIVPLITAAFLARLTILCSHLGETPLYKTPFASGESRQRAGYKGRKRLYSILRLWRDYSNFNITGLINQQLELAI